MNGEILTTPVTGGGCYSLTGAQSPPQLGCAPIGMAPNSSSGLLCLCDQNYCNTDQLASEAEKTVEFEKFLKFSLTEPKFF